MDNHSRRPDVSSGMTEPAQQASPPACGPTVYFDGACALCRREIAFYQRTDKTGAVTFVDVSKPDAACGPDLDRTQALQRFHLRNPDGSLVSGAAAFTQLWAHLPGFRHLARLTRGPRTQAVLERAYRAFLPIRPRLSRLVGRLDRDKPKASS
jgi:predicted DCC family thiol-disulfide oxidoreductase YuxK